MAKQVTSFAATERNQFFLNSASNKSQLINEALDAYRKYKLAKEMREGKEMEDKEDSELANMGMKDYFDIIEGDE